MVRLSTDNLVKQMDAAGAIELTDDQVRQLQSAILSMADDVIGICEEEGIAYTLGGGTCLGAIRHKGFIPWDDDMDFNVLRRDYDRLVRLVRERLGDRCWVHAPEDKGCMAIPSLRIELKGTRVRGITNVSDEACGASIDFFVVENAPRNAIVRKLHEVLCMGMGFALSCRRYAAEKEELAPRLVDGTEAARSLRFKMAIGSLLSLASLDAWTKWCVRAYSLCRDESSPYLVIPSGRRHYVGEVYPREMFLPTRRADFEGRRWYIPNDAAGYMVSLYGPDYMTPPPPEKRERHVLYEFDLGEYGRGASQAGDDVCRAEAGDAS